MTLRVVNLFLCPTCNRYTLHMPRLSRDGTWLVDHTLVERPFYKKATITVPYRWCIISALDLTTWDNFTRTVIRV